MSLKHISLGRMISGGGLALLVGGLTAGQAAFAAGHATFPGYRWPSGKHLAYQVQITAKVGFDMTSPRKSQVTSTITWNPVANLTTGQATASGMPITLGFAKGPLTVATNMPGVGTHSQHVTLGGVKMTGILHADGRMKVTGISMPAGAPTLPGVSMKTLMPMGAMPFMPPVPKAGWTAGHGFLAPYEFHQSAFSGASSGPSIKVSTHGLGEWVVPTVGNHHWHVGVKMKTVHPMDLTITSPAPQGSGQVVIKEQMLSDLYSHYLLNGQTGGLLQSEQSGGHMNITMAGKIPIKSSSGGSSTLDLAAVVHVTLHATMKRVKPGA